MTKHVLIPFRHAKKVQPYMDAVRAAGIEPLLADVGQPVALGTAAGLVLMGGTDVNPARYGAERQPETEQPDDARDEAELQLIEEALQADVPIFAICRGLQILNVAHGGTLVQHVASATRHDVETANKALAAHEVSIEPDSLLGKIAEVERWQVNSRHHQAAGRIGVPLRVVATDLEDGMVEALERKDKRFVLAVQWHPEDQIRDFPGQLRLFARFADAL